MKKESEELKNIILKFYEKYAETGEKITSINLSDEKWSLKEIIGHLVDSASNNHQRFVRLQQEKEIIFPSYHYNWIKVENYNSCSFRMLIDLWKNFNLLLAHIIENTEPENLTNTWITEDGLLKLEFIIKDYIRHLKEHIIHFTERFKEILSAKD